MPEGINEEVPTPQPLVAPTFGARKFTIDDSVVNKCIRLTEQLEGEQQQLCIELLQDMQKYPEG